MPTIHQPKIVHIQRKINVWKLLSILLLLCTIIFFIAWYSATHSLKANRNELRETFGVQYSNIVEQLNQLIADNINGVNIPEQIRDHLLSNLTIAQYTGGQLEEQLNKRDSSKLNMIIVVLNALQQAIQNKQFQNYCHVSDQASVTDLEGYVYILDQFPNGTSEKQSGVQTFNEIMKQWRYRSIDELYSSCGLK